jgi:hypothetical protein
MLRNLTLLQYRLNVYRMPLAAYMKFTKGYNNSTSAVFYLPYTLTNFTL